VAAFNEAVVFELREFFRDGKLDPGRYDVPNYYAPQAHKGRILLDSTSDGRNGIDVPWTAEIAVAFTPEHRALVRAARVSTWEGLLAPIDPMGPYGDAAPHYEQMAHALGEAFAPENAFRYDRLHAEMLYAAHAFLLHARF
jgi:hypothetical protein